MAYINREEYTDANVYGYVYGWSRLKDGVWVTRYVGITTNLDRRERQHIYGYGNDILYKNILKYGIENFNVRIIDTANSLEELREKEIKYIAEYDTYNHGYNYDKGGGLPPIHFGKDNHNFGKTLSEDIKNKISETLKERYANGYKNAYACAPKNEKTKQKISEALKGKYSGKENPFHQGAIKVYDAKTNEFVGWYESASECARKLVSVNGKKLSVGRIGEVAKGKFKTHGGYIFKKTSIKEYEQYLSNQVEHTA